MKQNFEQSEGLFVKIYRTIPELNIFLLIFQQKLKKRVILVPFQFSKPTYKSSLISLKNPIVQVQKSEYLMNRLSKFKKQTHSGILLLGAFK